MKVVYIIIFILTLTSSALSSSWHHPLYVGDGGYWKARIPKTEPLIVATKEVDIRTWQCAVSSASRSAKKVRTVGKSCTRCAYPCLYGSKTPKRWWEI